MIEVPCPQCDVLIEAPDETAGHAVVCPQCGATVTVPVPASAQVIEVHAEALDDGDEPSRYEEDPFFNPDAQRPAGPDQIWGRTVHVQRMGNGGGGCCMGGCLVIGLLFFFTAYGIVSFFTG